MATERLIARLKTLLSQGHRFKYPIPGFSGWSHTNRQAFYVWRGEAIAAITELGRWGRGHIRDIESVTEEQEAPPRVFAALEAACRTAEHRRQTERELEQKEAAKALREKKQQEKERARAMKTEKQKPGQDVFLVHGHDHKLLHEAARILNRLLGKDPIILFEQPGKAKTLVEKLEHYGPQAGFAVVLLTADDVGKAAIDPDLRPRARQNVILELGYFVGLLGRSNVAALVDDGVETPSDYHGVEYIPVDASGAWKTKLAQEMTAAGLPVDAAKLI